MKPLIIYRSKDESRLEAQFSEEKTVAKQIVHLKESGWDVLGVVYLKNSISVQRVEALRA